MSVLKKSLNPSGNALLGFQYDVVLLGLKCVPVVQCLHREIAYGRPRVDSIVATLPFTACIFMKNYPSRMKFSMTGF